MSTCTCGRMTSHGWPMCERCTALTVFGLTRDATPAEIKDAYRLLAKVWHPDRFQDDEDLKLKAEEQLKRINSAYQALTAPSATDNAIPGAESGSAPHAGQRQPSSPEDSSAGAHRRPSATPYRSSNRTRSVSRAWLAVAFALLTGGGAWLVLHSMTPHDMTPSAISRSAPQPAANPSSDSSRKTTVEDAPPAVAPNDSAGPTGKTAPNVGKNIVASERASLLVYPDDDPRVPYFTVGSTKDDVKRVQGTPSGIAENAFQYGSSIVYFQNGRVQYWHADPSSPLKARMPE